TGCRPSGLRRWTRPVPATPSTAPWPRRWPAARPTSPPMSASPAVMRRCPPRRTGPRWPCRPGPDSPNASRPARSQSLTRIVRITPAAPPAPPQPMTRPPLLSAALLAVLSLPLHAEDALPVTELGKVTVSASTSRLPDSEAALPNTITVITAEELQEQLAVTRDLSQVLANLIPAFAPSRQKMSSFGESLR